MPPRKRPRLVTARERARVAELHAQGLSRNAIAKELGRPWSTITKVAKELGLSFDRAATEKAVAAKVIDNKARRAQLSEDLLHDAQRLRERAWSSYSWYERTKDDVVKVTAELPPLADVRNAYTAIAIAIDKHAVLEKLDSDSGAAGARSMLGALGEALQVAAEQINQTPTERDGSG